MLLRKREQKLRIHQAQDALLAIKTSDPSIHTQTKKNKKKIPIRQAKGWGEGRERPAAGKEARLRIYLRRWRGIGPALGDSTGGGGGFDWRRRIGPSATEESGSEWRLLATDA